MALVVQLVVGELELVKAIFVCFFIIFMFLAWFYHIFFVFIIFINESESENESERYIMI